MKNELPNDADRSTLANRLYWDSDTSVNQMAKELGLSKGSLYQLIAPLDAGLPCPRCGADLAYPNRTARIKGFLSCGTCDFEGDLDEAEIAASAPLPVHVPSDDEVPAESAPLSGRFILGTVLLSVAAGVILARLTRKE